MIDRCPLCGDELNFIETGYGNILSCSKVESKLGCVHFSMSQRRSLDKAKSINYWADDVGFNYWIDERLMSYHYIFEGDWVTHTQHIAIESLEEFISFCKLFKSNLLFL
jgi:hypothetical protein